MEISKATVIQQAMKFYDSRGVVPGNISARRVHSGSDSQAWIVDEKWVFRFGTHYDSEAAFTCEMKLLDCLQSSALCGLICPCIQYKTLNAQDIRYGVYPKAEGYSIDEAAELMTETTDDGLAALLQSLRNFEIQSAKATGVGEGQPMDLPKLREDAIKAWTLVQEDLSLGDARKINVQVSIPPFGGCSDHPMVLLHADLKGEHLFISHEEGRLTGVIDWSDSCIGCPSIDIAGLAISVGARRAARVAVKAGYTMEVIEDGISLARCNTILQFAINLRGEDDSPYLLVRKQLLMAFQGWG